MQFIRSPEIEHRNDFADLLNRRGLVVYAVEIGTNQAEFACIFRERWNGAWLLCVDPWRDMPEYDEMQYSREEDYAIAVHILSRWPGRVDIFRGTTAELLQSKRLRSHAIEFCYIDADHQYEACAYDIKSMWPLIADNGILAGHDFDEEHPGVVRAVVEFAQTYDLTIYLTREQRFKSWYTYKHDMRLDEEILKNMAQ